LERDREVLGMKGFWLENKSEAQPQKWQASGGEIAGETQRAKA